MRSYIGHDVCEYPDSDKIIIVPNGETFKRSEQHTYFEGETNIDTIWENLRNKFHKQFPYLLRIENVTNRFAENLL